MVFCNFLVAHIDNIALAMASFANETIKRFEFLADTDRSHR